MDNLQVNNLINTAASDAVANHISSTGTHNTDKTSSADKSDASKKTDNNKVKDDSSVKTVGKKHKKDDDRYDYLSDKSDDGDTLQISPRGHEELTDGFVVKVKITKPAEKDSSAEDDSAPSALESYESSLTSYNGISDAKLRQMYLKGIISQYTYQKEMDNRAAKAEKIQNESVSTTRTITAVVSNSSDIAETAEVIKSAYSGDAKDAEISTEFIKAMDTVKNNSPDDPNSNFNLSIS